MVFHVFTISLDGGTDKLRSIGIAADELGGWGEGEVDEVVKDENLSVAIGTGTDADGGDGEG